MCVGKGRVVMIAGGRGVWVCRCVKVCMEVTECGSGCVGVGVGVLVGWVSAFWTSEIVYM